VACTVVGRPRLVLLDEPASALDPQGRREVLDLITRLRGSATILFSSHILGDVQEVCDIVGILDDGRQLFEGPMRSLLVGQAIPRVHVSLRADAERVAAALARLEWVTGVDDLGDDTVAVAVTSLDLAERHLPGTLVAVVVAAGSLAFDAIPEMGIFLRTRVPRVVTILTPRLVVVAVATVAAFTLGSLMAWYETWALIGPLPAGSVLAGSAFGALFLTFVIALVAAVAGWARNVLGTVMASLVLLLLMPILGVVDPVAAWVPTRLASALAELPAGAAARDYLPATTVTLVVTVGLVGLAVFGAGRREL